MSVCLCLCGAKGRPSLLSQTRSRCSAGLPSHNQLQPHRSRPDGWPHTVEPWRHKRTEDVGCFVILLAPSTFRMEEAVQKVICTCNFKGPMFLTGGGWQGRSTTKMWLLREAELTRLDAVTVTLNSPVLQGVIHNKCTHNQANLKSVLTVKLTNGRCAVLCSVQAWRICLRSSTGRWHWSQHWPDSSVSRFGSAGRTPGGAACLAWLLSGWPAGTRQRCRRSDLLTWPQLHHTYIEEKGKVLFRGDQGPSVLHLCHIPARFAVSFGDGPWSSPGRSGVPKVPQELHRARLFFYHSQESDISICWINLLCCVNLYCKWTKISLLKKGKELWCEKTRNEGTVNPSYWGDLIQHKCLLCD